MASPEGPLSSDGPGDEAEHAATVVGPGAEPVTVLLFASARLAAGMAFWAFFAVFPLLLVLVSLLGFFLPDGIKSEVMHNVAEVILRGEPGERGDRPAGVGIVLEMGFAQFHGRG